MEESRTKVKSTERRGGRVSLFTFTRLLYNYKLKDTNFCFLIILYFKCTKCRYIFMLFFNTELLQEPYTNESEQIYFDRNCGYSLKD